MRLHVTSGVVWLLLMAVPTPVHAAQFTGKDEACGAWWG
jgi:hypothetical protein